MRLLVTAQLARVADFIPAVLFTLLLARMIGPGPYGVYAIITTSTYLAGAVLPPSLVDLFGRHLAARPGRTRSIVGTALLARLPMTFIGSVALLGYLVTLNKVLLSSADLAVALVVFLTLEASNFLQAVAAGSLAYRSLGWARLAGRSLSLFALVGLYLTGSLNITAALLALAAGSLLTALWCTAPLRRALAASVSLAPDDLPAVRAAKDGAGREALGFGIRAWPAALLTLGLGTQKDVLLLSAFGVAPVAIGAYSVAATLTVQLNLLLVGGWAPAALPLLSRLRHEGRSINDQWRSYVGLWVLLVVPAYIALADGAPTVVGRLLGGDYAAAVVPILVFAAGQSIAAIFGGTINQVALLASDRIGVVTFARVVAVSANIALAVVLIPRYGPLAAAAATGGAVIVDTVIQYAALRQLFGFHLPWRRINAVLACVGFGLVAMFTARALGASPLARSAAYCSAAIGAATIAWLAMRHRGSRRQRDARDMVV